MSREPGSPDRDGTHKASPSEQEVGWPPHSARIAVAIVVVGLLGFAVWLFPGGDPAPVDDFEAGDASVYTLVRSDTSDGGFAVIESPVLARHGDHALEGWTGDNGDPTYLLSTSGLEGYPEPGDTFTCSLRSSDGASADPDATQHNMCMFGVESEDEVSGYGVGFHELHDEFRIYRYDGPKDRHVLDNASYKVPTSTWFDVHVDWGTEGSIEAQLLDREGTQRAAISATDTTYDAHGIGYNINAQWGGNNTVVFDHYRFQAESPLDLLVSAATR